MDNRHFDRLARILSHTGARRGVLHVLATLPLGGLTALLGNEESAAKSRRTKAHHERQLSAEKKRKKKKHKKCKPQPLATTCAGKCGGSVTNNCKKTVDCGSCAAGQVCLASTCQFCGFPGDPCCAGNACQSDDVVCLAGTCELCGLAGEPCCAGSFCESEFAVCVAGTCESCGLAGDRCCSGNTCDVGRICLEGACENCGLPGEQCCDGESCFEGTCSAGECPE